MNARWPFRSLAKIAFGDRAAEWIDRAGRQRCLVGIDPDCRHVVLRATCSMDLGMDGSSALSETRSYEATSGPLNREGGGTC